MSFKELEKWGTVTTPTVTIKRQPPKKEWFCRYWPQVYLCCVHITVAGMKRQLSSSRKRHPCVRPQGLFHLPAVSWEWRRHRETGLGLEPTPVNTEWTRPWWLSCRSSHPLLWDIRPFHCCTGQIVSVLRYVEFGHYLIVHIKSNLKPTQGLQPFLMGKTSISHQWVLVVSPDKCQC